MIFDVRSTIVAESTPYGVNVIRSRLAEELCKSHAKVKMEESGDITWAASLIYFEFFNIMSRALAGSEGRIKVTENVDGIIEINLHVAWPIGEWGLIFVSLCFIGYYFFGGLSAGTLLLLLIMWIVFYLYVQTFRRWWFKGFVKRQI